MFEEARATLDDIPAKKTDAPTALIAVTQLPVIEERLREVKETIELAVVEAKSMIAEPDTIQAVKNRRADLRKQFDSLEMQRKAVKEQIMAPYIRFESVYRECISGPFTDADKALKTTIDGFENELKDKTIRKLKDYYAELCEAEQIDWLPFIKAMQYGNIKVGVTDTKAKTPRKLMDALANVVSTVALGMDQIRKMDDSAEIMAEYKTCLDVGKAVANVQERKRAVEAEKEAAEKQKETDAKRAETIAKVEAAAAQAPVATPKARPLNKTMSFRIHFKTVEEFEKVKPILAQLKETLIREGIQYE